MTHDMHVCSCRVGGEPSTCAVDSFLSIDPLVVIVIEFSEASPRGSTKLPRLQSRFVPYEGMPSIEMIRILALDPVSETDGDNNSTSTSTSNNDDDDEARNPTPQLGPGGKPSLVVQYPPATANEMINHKLEQSHPEDFFLPSKPLQYVDAGNANARYEWSGSGSLSEPESFVFVGTRIDGTKYYIHCCVVHVVCYLFLSNV